MMRRRVAVALIKRANVVVVVEMKVVAPEVINGKVIFFNTRSRYMKRTTFFIAITKRFRMCGKSRKRSNSH